MRALWTALLLGACATTPAPPPERLAGCWINRDAGAVTMRWLPDRSRPGVLRGHRASYGAVGVNNSRRFTLEPRDNHWVLCETFEGAEARCWRVAQGESGSLEGGRAFVDRHGDRLRIAILGDGDEQVIFQGRRDGCD